MHFISHCIKLWTSKHYETLKVQTFNENWNCTIVTAPAYATRAGLSNITDYSATFKCKQATYVTTFILTEIKNLEKFGESQSHRNKITLSVSFVVIAGIWLDSANPMINNGSTCIHCRGASWWTRSITVIMNTHFKICKTAPMKNCRNFRIPSSAKDKALEISVWIAITVVLSRCSYVWKTYSLSETP